MGRKVLTCALLLCALGCGAAVASAQEVKAQTPSATPTPAATATPVAPASGFRAEFLKELDVTQRYYLSLAESIPAEKYSWRPGEGARSFSEVFLHVAGVNLEFPGLVGTPSPEGFKYDGFETSMTAKADVVKALQQSFAHIRQSVANVSDADGDKAIKWFGRPNTVRGFFLFMTRHMAEHLGQSIAYARINGITPPWTEEQQRRRQQQQQQQQKPQTPPTTPAKP